jgi:RNA polymerase subunit RPABC4/transcription elongation factor Spt4
MNEKIRSTMLTILATLFFFGGLLIMFFYGLFILLFYGFANFLYLFITIPIVPFLVVGVIEILLGFCALIAGLGLWGLRSWARKIAIYVSIVILFVNIIYLILSIVGSRIDIARVVTFFILIIINIGIILSLKSKNIKSYFPAANTSSVIQDLSSITTWKNPPMIQSDSIQKESASFCPNCKKIVKQEWVKCPYCKAELKKASEKKTEEKSLCPSCGKPIQDEWIKCPYCDTPLKLLCPKCSNNIQKEWKTCPYCNNPLVDICTVCKKEIEKNWKSCPYCGSRLTKEKKST